MDQPKRDGEPDAPPSELAATQLILLLLAAVGRLERNASLHLRTESIRIAFYALEHTLNCLIACDS